MKVKIMDTVQEWNREDIIMGTYLVEITETEFSNGSKVVVRNGDNVMIISHYIDNKIRLDGITDFFKDAFMENFK